MCSNKVWEFAASIATAAEFFDHRDREHPWEHGRNDLRKRWAGQGPKDRAGAASFGFGGVSSEWPRWPHCSRDRSHALDVAVRLARSVLWGEHLGAGVGFFRKGPHADHGAVVLDLEYDHTSLVTELPAGGEEVAIA